ncbi:uncharacterized protein LOC62_03G004800 [Vanrija pseudolonga]|uniref:Uncharacterized protein n=1 Tax=Vanrija pseudolonga TaxID=143232 RepID=A0AAF0YBB5_9TREE|nr:hypothetical protein LOC62_03G004800 [Vanrija pseudolonga]
MSARVPFGTNARRQILDRVSNPAIIAIPAPLTGNNVPFSLKKTRRNWKPNTKRASFPVTLLGDAQERTWRAYDEALETGRTKVKLPQLQGVRINARDIRSVQKAGGVEGMLLSRPSKHFTSFGRQLRNDLFNQLHGLRYEMLRAKQLELEQLEAPKAAETEPGLPLIEGGERP